MKFHERFDLIINLEDAQHHFVNRVYNQIYGTFLDSFSNNERFKLARAMATGVGAPYSMSASLDRVIGLDFLTNLKAIESLYERTPARDRRVISDHVQRFLSESEVDLSVEWRDGRFWRKGAALLDERLVNDVLQWLRQPGYETVLKPFEKGLRHLLQGHLHKDHLQDVITDVYEALEGLAKIVTGRDRDLSGNRESFISATKASDAYKALMKEYIEYANRFRHAESEGKPKPAITEREVESFAYMTGIFMRLAMP
jgi:hypothetical protein